MCTHVQEHSTSVLAHVTLASSDFMARDYSISFFPLCVTRINIFWGKQQLVQILHFFLKEEHVAKVFDD